MKTSAYLKIYILLITAYFKIYLKFSFSFSYAKCYISKLVLVKHPFAIPFICQNVLKYTLVGKKVNCLSVKNLTVAGFYHWVDNKCYVKMALALQI